MAVSRRVNWFSRVQRKRFASAHTLPVLLRNLGLLVVSALTVEVSRPALRAAEARKTAIDLVTISRPFFDPTAGQSVGITIKVREAGTLTLVVVDRDGYSVRRLLDGAHVEFGSLSYTWDGRDDRGAIVPDEAFSLRATLKTRDGISTYFPADDPAREIEAQPGYYDRKTGVFRYELPVAARVHMQAGTARLDTKTGKKNGPVLKTLVNREPRPSGAVIENWNGFDETGSFYVPDLPDFVMAVFATTLPENSIITYGNRIETFLEAVSGRVGASLISRKETTHGHHRGLTTLEDVAPELRIAPENASQSSPRHPWSTKDASLHGSLSLAGPSAAAFARQPGKVFVFVDGRRSSVAVTAVSPTRFEIPITHLSPGLHQVAFNWASQNGPVAVSSLQLIVPGPSAKGKEAGK